MLTQDTTQQLRGLRTARIHSHTYQALFTLSVTVISSGGKQNTSPSLVHVPGQTLTENCSKCPHGKSLTLASHTELLSKYFVSVWPDIKAFPPLGIGIHSADSPVSKSMLLITFKLLHINRHTMCMDSCTSQAPAQLSKKEQVGHHNPSITFPMRHLLSKPKPELSKPTIHI